MRYDRSIPDQPTTASSYAKFAGISKSTARRWAKAGRIPAFILPGGMVRILPEAYSDLASTPAEPSQ